MCVDLVSPAALPCCSPATLGKTAFRRLSSSRSREANRQESLQRAQAVVSPSIRAIVHRQIGVLQIHVCKLLFRN